MYIKLADIKKHLNIEQCYGGDDDLLVSLFNISISVLELHTDRVIESLLVNGKLIPTAYHAIMLLIGHYYSYRESVTSANVKELPLGFEFLCNQIRNFGTQNNKTI